MLSGEGKGTAEWCNVANEQGQILMSVLTCEESLDKMRPMAEGLMARYRRAGEAPPELMYVDRGCCRVLGLTSLEQLFNEWADAGMLIRLDIFHWIHRFDAVLRTDHHSKYKLFMSALSAAVFAYNKDDMALLLQAIRVGHPTKYDYLTDSELIETHVSKYDLTHYVRTITVGAQETCVQSVIDTLKGAAGMDENQGATEVEGEEVEGEDVSYDSDGEVDRLTPLRKSLGLTDQVVAAELDPAVEDVCGPNHLPGYEHIEERSKVLVDISLEEGKLAISDVNRQRVICAWNKLDLHDRSIQQFDSFYSARWGNALFGRTSGDPAEASLVQKLKFSKRYSAAHLLDARKKQTHRMQQRVTVDDPELSKLGIPILKINTKSVSEFIRRQEALSATNVTDQGLGVPRRHQSISHTCTRVTGGTAAHKQTSGAVRHHTIFGRD
ncbi:hypothetical protein ACEWY4_021520 [Coilia grayii]|uniref:Uncharacterized protein n=1 Tax=Coilia grayii TaxID=363190 RepID=A0ABD1J9A8_9TELE